MEATTTAIEQITSAADTVAETVSSGNYSTIFVILMGIGVVFFGLICIIVLCTIMGKIVGLIEKKAPAADAPAAAAVPAQASTLTPEKRREMIAAISAVIAEELGTDVSAIRVTSFKQV